MTLARILCVIVLLLEARGLSLSVSDRKWRILIFYTQLSNLVTTVSALLLVVLGQSVWVTTLRYLSTCMLVMTFFVTTCELIPMGGDRVCFTPGQGEEHGWLEMILPRETECLRPPVANVTLLAIVIATVPEPDMVLADRLISRAFSSG